MSQIMRMFTSGQAARDVAKQLKKAEGLAKFPNRTRLFKPFAPHVVSPASDGNEQSVRKAVDDGILPAGLARACLKGLERGRHVVIVQCAFGYSQEALQILEAKGPVDTDKVPEVRDSDAGLLSDFLGMPTLTSSRTPLSSLLRLPMGKPGTVLGSGASSFTVSSKTGMPELSRSGPVLGSGVSNFSFSRMFRIPELSRSGPVLGGGLTRNPTPLSSAVRMPTLTKASGDQ